MLLSHIERQPPGGWKKWEAEHSPPGFEKKLAATADPDQRLGIIELIRTSLEPEKAAVGLLITKAEWVQARLSISPAGVQKAPSGKMEGIGFRTRNLGR